MSDRQSMINQNQEKILTALAHLIEVVAQLRNPDGGCPWDLKQTQQSLIPYVLEEAYEVVDALNSKNQAEIAEELGDLLLQVVLQAQVAQDNGDFNLEDVAKNITTKLVRRHPHVFGDIEVADEKEVRQNWEKIKQAEKANQKIPNQLSDKLKNYNRTFPPLMASLKISKQAAKEGFEWETAEGVWDKFREELQEFQEAIDKGDKEHATEELGDLLFTVINLARWYDIEPNIALQGTNQRFIQRISLMEKFASRPLSEHTINELEALWQNAKANLK